MGFKGRGKDDVLSRRQTDTLCYLPKVNVGLAFSFGGCVQEEVLLQMLMLSTHLWKERNQRKCGSKKSVGWACTLVWTLFKRFGKYAYFFSMRVVSIVSFDSRQQQKKQQTSQNVKLNNLIRLHLGIKLLLNKLIRTCYRDCGTSGLQIISWLIHQLNQ